MKIDMHCHVREGSVDSRVSLDEYITTLKEKGFDGMLITDHDTYHGYRHWKYHMKGKVHEDFVVLKGIEYDTLDAGHIICIMPEGVKMRLLEVKGLPVSVLIDTLYRQIIMTGGVPYSLSVPQIPTRDSMTEAQFNAMMEKGYQQAKNGQAIPVDEAFAQIRSEL